MNKMPIVASIAVAADPNTGHVNFVIVFEPEEGQEQGTTIVIPATPDEAAQIGGLLISHAAIAGTAALALQAKAQRHLYVAGGPN